MLLSVRDPGCRTDPLKKEVTLKNYIGLEDSVKESIYHFLEWMFPCFYGDNEEFVRTEEDTEAKKVLQMTLGMSCLKQALKKVQLDRETIKQVLDTMESRMPAVRELILTDIDAAYKGDPAAKDTDEIILAYPGFKAISTYRIAHELYLLKVPIIPRLMTEHMHSLTGIDIHPGATIGPYFFIDHGTGVVIGETTTIGEHVKLYQHVTLGAKSFEVGEDGTLVKGIKRHPDIGDRVVVYAGATILGGDTVIGHDAVIGGNTWITHSVAPFDMVKIHVYDQKTDKLTQI